MFPVHSLYSRVSAFLCSLPNRGCFRPVLTWHRACLLAASFIFFYCNIYYRDGRGAGNGWKVGRGREAGDNNTKQLTCVCTKRILYLVYIIYVVICVCFDGEIALVFVGGIFWRVERGQLATRTCLNVSCYMIWTLSEQEVALLSPPVRPIL